MNLELKNLSSNIISNKDFKYYEVYNASEGFFGIQDTNDGRDLLLMLDYGILHHVGFKTASNSMIPNKNVPARPFFTTTAKNQVKINKEFMKNIKKALKK